MKTQQDLQQWISLNPRATIIGVDEAGRGCLCGPVYAGAVLFKNSDQNPENLNKTLYKDSKLLTATQRETIFQDILENHWVGVGFANSQEVDSINILQATFLAMKRAIRNLLINILTDELKVNQQDVIKIIDSLNEVSTLNGQGWGVDILERVQVIIDGNQKIPHFNQLPQRTLIKGDRLLAEISAASIVAKVSRDRYVDSLDAQYPGYEFSRHKGYGTALHKEKIKELGPCPEHRTTFKGVREFLQNVPQQSY